MLTRFVRTKFVAIYLGPAGTGIVSALTIFLGMLTVLGSLGTRRAAVKQIAVAHKEGTSSAHYREVMTSAFFLVFVTSVCVVLAVSVFSKGISQNLFGQETYHSYVMAIGFILPVASLFSL